MRRSFSVLSLAFLALTMFALGCNQPAPPAGGAAAEKDHDHADDHDHGDEKHADDHDHGDEKHADHDHDDHGHDHGDGEHKHPETLVEAVTQIDELVGKIKTAFADGKDQEADSDVHEVGHLLEDAERLIDKSELADDAKAAVKSAVTDLFDAFNKIDEKLHGGEGSTFADEEEKINAALATLKEHAK